MTKYQLLYTIIPNKIKKSRLGNNNLLGYEKEDDINEVKGTKHKIAEANPAWKKIKGAADKIKLITNNAAQFFLI